MNNLKEELEKALQLQKLMPTGDLNAAKAVKDAESAVKASAPAPKPVPKPVAKPVDKPVVKPAPKKTRG